MITSRNANVVPFIYAVEITLTASSLGSSNITLSADSWFELVSLDASTDQASNQTDYNPNSFSVLITDQGTGRALSSAKIHQRNICGNACHGRFQRNSVRFAPQTTLQFEFQNLVSATNNIQLSLVGYKLFGGPGV